MSTKNNFFLGPMCGGAQNTCFFSHMCEVEKWLLKISIYRQSFSLFFEHRPKTKNSPVPFFCLQNTTSALTHVCRLLKKELPKRMCGGEAAPSNQVYVSHISKHLLLRILQYFSKYIAGDGCGLKQALLEICQRLAYALRAEKLYTCHEWAQMTLFYPSIWNKSTCSLAGKDISKERRAHPMCRVESLFKKHRQSSHVRWVQSFSHNEKDNVYLLLSRIYIKEHTHLISCDSCQKCPTTIYRGLLRLETPLHR